jgi:hypothetical protein
MKISSIENENKPKSVSTDRTTNIKKQEQQHQISGTKLVRNKIHQQHEGKCR